MFGSKTLKLQLTALASLLAVVFIAPASLSAADAPSGGKLKVSHLYIYGPTGDLLTYSSVAGSVTGIDVQTMFIGPHPTVKDASGKACSVIEVTPAAGKRAHLKWIDAWTEEKEVVVDDEKFVLCDQQLPNHDQLQYPPD